MFLVSRAQIEKVWVSKPFALLKLQRLVMLEVLTSLVTDSGLRDN